MKGMERQEQGRHPCEATRKEPCGNKIQHDHRRYAENCRWQAYQEFAVTQPQPKMQQKIVQALIPIEERRARRLMDGSPHRLQIPAGNFDARRLIQPETLGSELPQAHSRCQRS